MNLTDEALPDSDDIDSHPFISDIPCHNDPGTGDDDSFRERRRRKLQDEQTGEEEVPWHSYEKQDDDQLIFKSVESHRLPVCGNDQRRSSAANFIRQQTPFQCLCGMRFSTKQLCPSCILSSGQVVYMKLL